MSLQLLAGLVFTYALAPLALFLLLRRLTRSHGAPSPLLLALSFAFAPALIARIVIWSFRAAPGQSDGFHAVVVLCVFGAIAWLGRNEVPAVAAGLSTCRGFLSRKRVSAGILGASLLIALLLLFSAGPRTWLYSQTTSLLSGLTAGTGWTAVMPPRLWLFLGVFVIASVASSVVYSNRYRFFSVISNHITSYILCIVVIILIVINFYITLSLPIYENDAMQYFKVSAIFYDLRSISHYPLMPAAADGTFASSSHPLGHYGALIWSYIIAGRVTPGPGKLWALHAMLATGGVMTAVLYRHGVVAVLAALTFLYATIGYVMQVYGAGIDAQRQMLLLASVVALAAASQSRQPTAMMALAGIGAGLALNAHSQSLVLVILAIAVTVMLMPGSWLRRIGTGLVALSAAGLVGGEQYLFNLMQFGAPTFNDHLIWSIVPDLKYRDWRLGRAPRVDFWGKLGSGAFLGFSWWYFFALTWWIALVAVVTRARAVWQDPLLRNVAVVWLLGQAFLIMFFGFTASGELLVMNYRYALAFHPLPAVLAGYLVGCLVTRSTGLVTPFAVSAGLAAVVLTVWQSLTVQLPQMSLAMPLRLLATPAEELAALPAQPGPNQFAELETMKEVRAKTPKEAYFVVFHMNTFAYYADRRFVRDVDPRMVPFYRAKDKGAAVAALRALGIDHIYLQPWSWPTVDNSLIKEIVADAALATMVLEKNGYRVFRLNGDGR